MGFENPFRKPKPEFKEATSARSMSPEDIATTQKSFEHVVETGLTPEQDAELAKIEAAFENGEYSALSARLDDVMKEADEIRSLPAGQTKHVRAYALKTKIEERGGNFYRPSNPHMLWGIRTESIPLESRDTLKDAVKEHPRFVEVIRKLDELTARAEEVNEGVNKLVNEAGAEKGEAA